jgi:hypothetical protein
VFSEAVAGATSRRGFLARTGRLLLGLAGGGYVLGAIRAQQAEAFHFCGHIYTTGSCPHPTGLPRIDANGFPLRAADGEPVDDLGRPVDKLGRPVDAHGKLLRDPDGNPLPPAPRTRSAPRPGVSSASAARSTAPGTAAATATSASSSTAAATRGTGSTATTR